MCKSGVFLIVWLASCQTLAAVGMGLGVQLGTDNGLSIGVKQWDIGVAVKGLVINVDRRFITGEFPALYFGLGAQVSDKSDEHVGVRFKVGLSARAGLVELFGEAVPNKTFGSNGDLNIDYHAGLRIWF